MQSPNNPVRIEGTSLFRNEFDNLGRYMVKQKLNPWHEASSIRPSRGHSRVAWEKGSRGALYFIWTIHCRGFVSQQGIWHVSIPFDPIAAHFVLLIFDCIGINLTYCTIFAQLSIIFSISVGEFGSATYTVIINKKVGLFRTPSPGKLVD